MYIRLYCLNLNDGKRNSLTVNDGKSNTSCMQVSRVKKFFLMLISNWAGIPLYRHDTKTGCSYFF